MSTDAVRVLHLFGQPSDFQTERSAAALRQGLGRDFAGDGGGDRAGRAVSESCIGRPRAALGRAAVRRRSRVGRDGARGGDPLRRGAGAIHADAAARAGGRSGGCGPCMGYRDVHVVCATATQRGGAWSAGVPLERCHLVRPGVDFGRVKRRRDPALRQAAWDRRSGLRPARPRRIDAGGRPRAGGLGGVDPWGARSEVQGAALGARAARRRAAMLGTRLGQPNLVRVAEERLGRAVEFEELLPAADTVLVAAGRPVATLPIAICMAAALPIVATVTYTTAELLEDRHTAAMVPPGPPRFLATGFSSCRRTPACSGRSPTWRGRRRTSTFSLTRFLSQYRAVYRQLAAGERVEVPEQAPGAGLRFHGRGGDVGRSSPGRPGGQACPPASRRSGDRGGRRGRRPYLRYDTICPIVWKPISS